MITGAHVIVYSKDAAADRAFLKDVLGSPSVDAGHGWLIFAMPAAEAAVHPADENDRHELQLTKFRHTSAKLFRLTTNEVVARRRVGLVKA